MKMFNKSQMKLMIFFVIILFSFFTLLNTANAALTPGDSILNAVNSANSGNVIELEGGGEFLLQGAEANIEIGKKITIKSNDSSKNAIINLNNGNRAFNITNNGNLTLINITIINGGNVEHGGAIYNNGTLAIEGCTFTKNTVYTYVFGSGGLGVDVFACGGVIYNENGVVDIIESMFTENTANVDANSMGDGSHARAHAYGGVIYNAKGVVNITGSTFTKNIADATAIATYDVYAYAYGGVIYNAKGVVKITESVFTENTVDADASNPVIVSDAYAYAQGSVIYNLGSSFDLQNNFYFWVLDSNNLNYNSLNNQINRDIYSTNNYHGSYYYIELSYNPDVVNGNDLVLDYSMKHSAGNDLNGLTVTDITLKIANMIQNDFIYDEDDLTLNLPVDGTDLVTLNYLDEEFYNIGYNIIILNDTTLTLDSGDVSGNVGDVVELVAILKDIDNNVLISGARVDFYVDGAFVGNNTTDTNGVAIFYYTLSTGLDSTYFAKYGGNNTYNSSTSSSSKIAIISINKPVDDPAISNSQINLYKNTDTYYVGDYITLTWSTNNITNPNAVGIIYFYEDGILQHSIQVRLSDGRLAYQFKKSHKSLNINLRFSGDNVTRSSQSTVSTIVYDKFIVKIIPSILTVAKRGYINVTVTDLDGNVIDGGFVTLQFDNYDIFKIPVVNDAAKFSKVLMQAGNSRLLRVSYADSNNVTRLSTKYRVRVNKGTPVMTLSLNPNNRAISNRVAITATVSSGVIKQKYVNIPYTVNFYSSGKLAHTINKKFSASSNSFVYNFKRTHSNLIITATLGTTANYNSATKKSSTLIVA